MSYPDHPPSRPLPFMPPPCPSENLGGYAPQTHMDNIGLASQNQFEQGLPLKRPRLYDNHQTHSAPPHPLNPRTSQPNTTGMRGTSSIFYKTRMCAKFRDGTCRNGESCTFAHGVEDMREPPPNWQEIIREKDREGGNWDDDQRIINRMKICRKFYNGGECPFGDSCSFLHESPLRYKTDIARPSLRETAAISIEKVGLVMEHRSDTRQAEFNRPMDANTDAIRVMKPWKTKICAKWETGQCPFGDRCHYAHGKSELQVHGAHIEPEIVSSNVHSIPTMALTQLGNNALPTKAEATIPLQERFNNEVLQRWKVGKKINTIYGDWPEDLIPPENMR